MSSGPDKRLFTYQTRVSVTAEQDQLLRHYGRLFGQVERKLFADLEKGKAAHQLKSEYQSRFDITARQFNALRIQLQGKIDSAKALMSVQSENLKTKIKKAKKTIAKLVRSSPGSTKLHEKRRRLARLEEKSKKLAADRQAGRVRICFGSKKLFHAQFHLQANGYPSHAEWQADWREARSGQFFIIGSKDETKGCQGCVATRQEDGSYWLRVRLPNGLGEKYTVISGVRFAYGQEQFEEALEYGRALCYRFVRDENGWRVLVTAEARRVKPITDRRLGRIGIDINPDQLVLAEVDRHGNFVGGQKIPCATADKSEDQAKAIIGDAVKRAIAAAVGSLKPLVIERLDFEKKKAALENEGRKRARMLTGFAYKQIIRHLEAAAFRAGVEVFQVNPAYTSTIGAVNYAYRYGISVHQGAAIAIARRSLGLSERPAWGVAQIPTPGGDHLTFPVPERKRGKHVWSLWSKVSRQIRAALTAHLLLLRKKPRSTPAVLSFRPQCAT